MRFKIKVKGFGKLKKEIKKMASESKTLEKGQDVTFEALFTPAFMRSYTNFDSFDELLTAGGFVVESQEDFEAIPDDKLDVHVRETTKFSSWLEMQDTAANEYVIKKLGF